MKFAILVSMIFLGLIPFAQAQIPGKPLSIYIQNNSGFGQDSFHVRVYATEKDSLRTFEKYLALGGAKRTSNGNDEYSYSLGYARISWERNMVRPEPTPHYNLQLFQIAYKDLLDHGGGGDSAFVEFGGSIADSLYAAMQKSGLKDVGSTIDENFKIIGYIYRDENLECKRGRVTTCRIN